MTADPQWLRSSLVEDLAGMVKASGEQVNMRAIEASVDEDIREWAAREREHPPRPVSDAAPPPRDTDACLDVAQQRANQREAKCTKTSQLRANCNGVVEDDIQEHECQCGGECKFCCMRQRILALMEPLPVKERWHVGPELWLNCKYPAFAKEIIRNGQARLRAPGLSPMRQRGQSDKDMNAETIRRLEDICDRSNSVPGLGRWWGV